MYVTHHPDNHTEWQERKEKFSRDKKEKNTSKDSDDSKKDSSSSKGEKKTLALSDKLKAAMVTKFRCSPSDAEKLWSEVSKQSN